MVGIQVGSEQEERKAKEGSRFRSIVIFHITSKAFEELRGRCIQARKIFELDYARSSSLERERRWCMQRGSMVYAEGGLWCMIRKRKLQWVAHCARRGEEGLTWKRMVREVEDGKSKWGTRLKEDWKELGVNTVRGWCNKVKDRDGWHPSWE